MVFVVRYVAKSHLTLTFVPFKFALSALDDSLKPVALGDGLFETNPPLTIKLQWVWGARWRRTIDWWEKFIRSHSFETWNCSWCRVSVMVLISIHHDELWMIDIPVTPPRSIGRTSFRAKSKLCVQHVRRCILGPSHIRRSYERHKLTASWAMS